MRPAKWYVLFLLSVLIWVCVAQAAIKMRGYALTDWYSFESLDSTRHQQIYETFSLRLERPGVHSLGLVTHLRWRGDSADDFGNSSVFQAHNLYLRYSHADRGDVRLGRQYLAEGVGFGAFDALRLTCSPKAQGSITLWGGVAAPQSREFEVQNLNEAPAFGAAVRGKVAGRVNVLGSFLYEEREGLKYRHRVGISTNAALLTNLTSTALAHFNLSGPNVLHRVRLLMRYTGMPKTRLSLEWAMGTPQLLPDSPWDAVEIGTFQLVRGSGAYRVRGDYWMGLRAQSILTTEIPNTTLGLTLEGPWGLLGYRQRFGDFGDESGIFGSAQYRPLSYAQIYGGVDFSRYKFEEGIDREDQAQGQVGLRLFPVKALTIDASLQALKNTQFDNDVRGLLRIKWSFSN